MDAAEILSEDKERCNGIENLIFDLSQEERTKKPPTQRWKKDFEVAVRKKGVHHRHNPLCADKLDGVEAQLHE